MALTLNPTLYMVLTLNPIFYLLAMLMGSVGELCAAPAPRFVEGPGGRGDANILCGNPVLWLGCWG